MIVLPLLFLIIHTQKPTIKSHTDKNDSFQQSGERGMSNPVRVCNLHRKKLSDPQFNLYIFVYCVLQSMSNWI